MLQPRREDCGAFCACANIIGTALVQSVFGDLLPPKKQFTILDSENSTELAVGVRTDRHRHQDLAAEIHGRVVKRYMAMRLPPMRRTGFPAMFGYEQSIRHHARF